MASTSPNGLGVEDRPSSPSFSDLFDDDGIPKLQGYHHYTIRKLLKTFKINHVDAPSDNTSIKVFWPTKVLEAILSRDRIAKALKNDSRFSNQSNSPVDTILGRTSGPQVDSYLKVLALLCLLERESEIGLWIDSKISDNSFPFRLRGEKIFDINDKQLNFLHGWKDMEYERFIEKQWAIFVPYFKLDDHGRAKHGEFYEPTMLPWRKPVQQDHLSWDASGRAEGGYGFVSGVMMAKSSHAFDPVLKRLGLKPNGFALKKLKKTAPDDVIDIKLRKQYDSEVAMLKQFGHSSQQHLIFLLTSFTLRNEFYFLFPHAKCDLHSYWTQEPGGPGGPEYMEWILRQLRGLVTAVYKLHLGDISLEDGEKRYCRHGDIRPANILWFESDTDKYGILVLADMGVAAFNRTYSRSKKPGHFVAQIPGYHPPEMVLADGVVNRAFDVWSLGCVFLDMVAWLLGGTPCLQAFNKARTEEGSGQARSDVFYDIVKEEKGNRYIAKVKDGVKKWMEDMYNHPQCTLAFKNLLWTIQKKMLVVIRNERAASKDLVPIFNDLRKDPSTSMPTVDEVDSTEEVEIAPDLLPSLQQSAAT